MMIMMMMMMTMMMMISAVSMLSALQTPNKWDDPKKPGIQVAQAE